MDSDTSSIDKTENYEDDAFYLELEMLILLLMAEDEKDESDKKDRNSEVVEDSSRITGENTTVHRNYYNWLVCQKTRPIFFYFPSNFSGTWVFIWHVIKSKLSTNKWSSCFPFSINSRGWDTVDKEGIG